MLAGLYKLLVVAVVVLLAVADGWYKCPCNADTCVAALGAAVVYKGWTIVPPAKVVVVVVGIAVTPAAAVPVKEGEAAFIG